MIIERNKQIKLLRKEYKEKKRQLKEIKNPDESLTLRKEINAILLRILELAR